MVTLQKRNKWPLPVRNLAVNDMVILMDGNKPPTKWKLGRIENVFPGRDGRVRNVEVRTEDSLLRRPVQKLAFLPIENDTTAEDAPASPGE